MGYPGWGLHKQGLRQIPALPSTSWVTLGNLFVSLNFSFRSNTVGFMPPPLPPPPPGGIEQIMCPKWLEHRAQWIIWSLHLLGGLQFAYWLNNNNSYNG